MGDEVGHGRVSGEPGYDVTLDGPWCGLGGPTSEPKETLDLNVEDGVVRLGDERTRE